MAISSKRLFVRQFDLSRQLRSLQVNTHTLHSCPVRSIKSRKSQDPNQRDRESAGIFAKITWRVGKCKFLFRQSLASLRLDPSQTLVRQTSRKIASTKLHIKKPPVSVGISLMMFVCARGFCQTLASDHCSEPVCSAERRLLQFC